VIPRFVMPSVLFLCAVQSAMAVSAEQEVVSVDLQGQRKFLDASIAFCIDKVPALKSELTRAREIAARELGKAEDLIASGIRPTIKQDRPLLEAFLASWKKNADDLVAALKKQNPATACPTLRDNWASMEADVIVEDWQMYLDRNRPEQ
jgi:hypothetical protein